MTPTNDRQEVLRFTEPYYYTPAVVVVPSDSTVTDVSTELDGTAIGVCSACTYEQYLDGTLEIEGFTFDFVIDDAQIQGYDTDTTALQDLSTGRLDAVITSATTAQGWIDDGNPAKIVGSTGLLRAAVGGVRHERPRSTAPRSRRRSTRSSADMHADGTLTTMSQEWFNGLDLTVQT